MKIALYPFCILIGLSTFMGCAKCITCKKDDYKYKICSKNSDNADDIDNSKAYYEALGYKCSTTSEAF